MCIGTGENEVSVRKLNEALSLASDSVSEMRRVIFDLHPTILDELGLVAALQRLVMLNDSDALHCTLHVEGAPARLPAPHELTLYRITQEAINNARRHAHAKNLRVQLRFQRDATLLLLNDAGRGIGTPVSRSQEAQPAAEHLGLKGMRERAQSVGGQFELDSQPG